MASKEANRRATLSYRERHRAEGLCIQCPLPAVPGNLRCEKCREKQRQHEKNHRERKALITVE